jgi:hypothetical protein
VAGSVGNGEGERILDAQQKGWDAWSGGDQGRDVAIGGRGFDANRTGSQRLRLGVLSAGLQYGPDQCQGSRGSQRSTRWSNIQAGSFRAETLIRGSVMIVEAQSDWGATGDANPCPVAKCAQPGRNGGEGLR